MSYQNIYFNKTQFNTTMKNLVKVPQLCTISYATILILLINPIWYHSWCAFNLPCFFHFIALKVYRHQRQVLWQQSVTTILSNIPTFLYFPCSYYICDTNTCFWWQHSLPLPFPRRYWKRWNYSLKEWIIGFVNESYARICRIPMHIISRLPNQLQSHKFICTFFAFKIGEYIVTLEICF